MPLTPFHLGPALLVDAAFGRWFGLGAFTLVQVAIDLEAAWNLVAGSPRVHTNLHTLLGALLVAAALIVPAHLVRNALAPGVRARLARRSDGLARLAPLFGRATWAATISGCLVGAVSHVLLDALMHADARPFAPWSDANPFLLPDAFLAVHAACFLAGLVGLPLWLLVRLRTR